jgi:RND family efflux transporter MFP subunit
MTWLPRAARRLPLGAAGWLLVCLALGCGRAPPPEEESHPAPVKAEPARRTTLEEWTDLLGTTQPLLGHAASVSAVVEGRVEAVLPDLKGKPVTEGQPVAKGQVIVQLDDRIPRANRAKLEAGLTELEEQRKQAGYAAALAKIDVERLEKLRPPGMADDTLPLVSRVELEKARISLKDAEAKEKAVAARQQSAKAELDALDAQLAFYTLKAPIAGRLGIVHAMPGQTLTPGTVVADVVALDEIDVLCFAAPHVVRRLKLDQPARLTRFDSTAVGETSSPQGKVAFLAVQGQAETGNFAVKVRFPNRELGLRANAVARLRVLTQTEKDALAIPAAALMEDQEPPTVVVVTSEKKDGKVENKAVRLKAEVGLRDRQRNLVELRGLRDPEANKEVPLRDGMLFVTEGGHGLESGDIVALPKEEHEKEK